MKYKLTSETMEWYGRILHRIEALESFGEVNAGDKGGWIEKEENLSHYGNCWVHNEASVADDAVVSGDAQVYDAAEIRDDAQVYEMATVYGRASIYDCAQVCGFSRVGYNATVRESARIEEGAGIYGDADVSGNARISGTAWLAGNERVCGNALIKLEGDVVAISGLDYNTITSYTTEEGIMVVHNFFTGTLQEYERHIRATYKNSPQERILLGIIDVLKNHFGV